MGRDSRTSARLPAAAATSIEAMPTVALTPPVSITEAVSSTPTTTAMTRKAEEDPVDLPERREDQGEEEGEPDRVDGQHQQRRQVRLVGDADGDDDPRDEEERRCVDEHRSQVRPPGLPGELGEVSRPSERHRGARPEGAQVPLHEAERQEQRHRGDRHGEAGTGAVDAEADHRRGEQPAGHAVEHELGEPVPGVGLGPGQAPPAHEDPPKRAAEHERRRGGDAPRGGGQRDRPQPEQRAHAGRHQARSQEQLLLVEQQHARAGDVGTQPHRHQDAGHRATELGPHEEGGSQADQGRASTEASESNASLLVSLRPRIVQPRTATAWLVPHATVRPTGRIHHEAPSAIR